MPLRPRIALLASFVALWLGAASAAPLPAAKAWERPVSPRVQQRALRRVLTHVYEAAQRGERPVVVVDIDDTAANGRLRLARAAGRAGLHATGLVSGDDLYAGLTGAALTTRRDAFHKLYFDDPKLLALDTPQRGARGFLRAVQQAGGEVLYVSGRWESTRPATERYLRRLRLPLARSADLLLNPSEALGASEWKLQAQAQIAARGKPIAAFDNEAEAAAGYHAAFPGAHVFRLATFRFRALPADKPADLLVLEDFSLDR